MAGLASGSLRAAVIGYGNIAPVHLDALGRITGVSVVAVCDDAPVRLEALRADRPETAAYADYRRMLAEVKPDVVHVCTPHHAHVAMAVDALCAGCHVVLEKPCAMNMAEGALLEREWRASGKLLGVCFQNRYRPAVREAKRLLDSGAYGAVLGIRGTVAWKRDAAYYASGTAWRGKWDSEGGGVLINQAIHTLDLIQWLGGGCVGASAIGGNLSLRGSIEVEDSAIVMLDLAGAGGRPSRGQAAIRGLLFATNANIEDSPVEIEILCEKARLRIADALYVAVRDGGPVEGPAILARSDDEEDDESSREADGKAGAPVAARKGYWGIRHLDLISDFYDCIRTGRAFPIDPVEGLKAIAILDRIYPGMGRS